MIIINNTRIKKSFFVTLSSLLIIHKWADNDRGFKHPQYALYINLKINTNDQFTKFKSFIYINLSFLYNRFPFSVIFLYFNLENL